MIPSPLRSAGLRPARDQRGGRHRPRAAQHATDR